MAARNCPECNGLVASTIDICPHCGYRFNADAKDEHNYTKARGLNPYNSLAWSVVGLIFVPLFGLISIIFYLMSDARWSAGDAAEAERYGHWSVQFVKIPMIAVIVPIVIFLIFILIMGLSNAA